jgi:uncharacterized RDD family membrane protein YckC
MTTSSHDKYKPKSSSETKEKHTDTHVVSHEEKPASPSHSSETKIGTTEYAGFWRRYAAFVYDSIFIGIVGAIIGGTLGAIGLTDLAGFAGFIVGATYVIGFWVKNNGQTPGKVFLKVQVVPEEGGPLNLTKAIIRYLGYILSSIVFYLGFIWAAFDGKKQTWHDKIAHTYVVSKGKPNGFVYGLGLFLGIVGPVLIIIVLILVIIGIGMFASSGKGQGLLNMFTDEKMQGLLQSSIECSEECQSSANQELCIQDCITTEMEEKGITQEELQESLMESGLIDEQDINMFQESEGMQDMMDDQQVQDMMDEEQMQELERQFEEQFGGELNLEDFENMPTGVESEN